MNTRNHDVCAMPDHGLETATFSLIAGFLTPLPYNYGKFRPHGQSCH
jgi:hypothetical protein